MLAKGNRPALGAVFRNLPGFKDTAVLVAVLACLVVVLPVDATRRHGLWKQLTASGPSAFDGSPSTAGRGGLPAVLSPGSRRVRRSVSSRMPLCLSEVVTEINDRRVPAVIRHVKCHQCSTCADLDGVCEPHYYRLRVFHVPHGCNDCTCWQPETLNVSVGCYCGILLE